MKIDGKHVITFDVNNRLKLPKHLLDKYPEDQYFMVVEENDGIKLKPVSINISEGSDNLATMNVSED